MSKYFTALEIPHDQLHQIFVCSDSVECVKLSRQSCTRLIPKIKENFDSQVNVYNIFLVYFISLKCDFF